MSRKKFESAFETREQAEILFPLFSAEGEKLWVPDWDYIATDVTDGGAGNAFLSGHALYSDDGGRTWQIGAVDEH